MQRTVRHAVVITAAAAATAYGVYSVVVWYRRRRYAGLEGIVSFSSRLIAAARAVESEEEDCMMMRDPLAAALAGPQAMAQITGRAVAYDAKEAQATAGVVLKRKFKASRIGLRTRWFEEQLLAALQRDSHPYPLAVQLSVPQQKGSAGGEACGALAVAVGYRDVPSQVVMLAAGMDARPWRLDCPPGTSWFEIDMPDVTAAKRAVLQHLGAQLPPQLPPQQLDGCCAPPAAHAPAQGSPRFPLRVSHWCSLACDLSCPGWGGVLQRHGFDARTPCVWLAEGLLMYLDIREVAAMMRECAAVSPPGSVFITAWNSDRGLQRLKSSKSELMRSWKSGHPPDIHKFFRDQGWHIVTADNRVSISQRYARAVPGLQFSYDTSSAAHSEREGGRFVVAVKR